MRARAPKNPPGQFLFPEWTSNTREPTWKVVQEVNTAARASTAPRPIGVPYKIYKHCPELLRIIWKILQVIWCRRTVADQWRQAERTGLLRKRTPQAGAVQIYFNS